LSLVLGVGPMKAGSTVVVHALSAATQLPLGFDCGLASWTNLTLLVKRREAPVTRLLEGCSEELFKWEITKDPAMTRVATQLAAAWPALSASGGALRLYFLARSPFEQVRSFIRSMNLPMNPRSQGPDTGQNFTSTDVPTGQRFTRGKQLALDTEREGLRYTGYMDAAAQRWVLTADEYLRCPQSFVLVRYEDFVDDPVGETQRLVEALGLSQHWSEESAAHVAHAAAYRYQNPRPAAEERGLAPEPPDYAEVFGAALHARLFAAMAERAERLGYAAHMGRAPSTEAVEAAREQPAIDVPPLPEPGLC